MATDIPGQLHELADILRGLMVMESVTHLQLSSLDERDRIRNIIDSGIDILAHLKSYRNAVASISFLPNELLSEIFLQVMIASDPWTTRWCRLILVCRRWHRVAMNDGRLWSWISDPPPSEGPRRIIRWAEKRSKGHSLALKCATKLYNPLIFAPNSHRIRFLVLDGKRSDLLDFFGDVKVMPMLENLRVRIRDTLQEQPTPWCIPSFLVEGGSPRIRRLCLDGISFSSPKELLLLANLTHLELTRLYLNRNILDALPSLNDFYHVLEHSPGLQSVKILHYIRIQHNTIDQAQMQHLSPLSLPALKLLDLNMDIQNITMLLRFLTLPPSTRTSFIAHPRDDDDDDSSYILDIKSFLIQIRLHLRHKDAPILRSAKVASSSYVSFSVFDKAICPFTRIFDDDVDVLPVTQILFYPDLQHERRQMLAKIVNALPLEKLEFLDGSFIMDDNHGSSTDSGQHFSEKTWQLLFRLLPPSLTVRIGVNNGMLALLKGVIDAMSRAPKAFPSGRRLKRRKRLFGFGSLPLSKLILLPSRTPGSLYSDVDPQDQERLYSGLLTHLTTYRDLDTGFKPKGKVLESLAFEEMQRWQYGNEFAERLFEVTGELSYEGTIFDPVEIRESVRRWRKEVRRMKRKYPDWDPPDSDPNASPLSSEDEEEDSDDL